MKRQFSIFALCPAIIVAVLSLFAVMPGTAYAGPIAKFEFTAEVFFSGVPWTTNGINVGDPVSGIVSYDLASSDTDANPDLGRYDQTLTMGVRISVGGFNFTSSDYMVDIEDDPLFGNDGIGFTFNENVSDGGITVLGFGNSPFLDLKGPTTIFDGDALLPVIDLSLFNVSRFGGLLSDGQGATQLQYTITSVQRVPEPASLALFLAGMAGIAGLAMFTAQRWRRTGHM